MVPVPSNANCTVGRTAGRRALGPPRELGAKQSATALGATASDFDAELGWRFPKLDHGAVVTKLDHGVLQDIGLAEHYIVIAVDGHDVADAAAFAKLVGSEYDTLVDKG